MSMRPASPAEAEATRSPRRTIYYVIGALLLVALAIASVGIWRSRLRAAEAAEKEAARARAVAEELAKEEEWKRQAKEALEPLYISLKQIEGATSAGVTYPRFMELLGSAETQMSISADK